MNKFFKLSYNSLASINLIKTKKFYKKVIFMHAPQSGGNSIDYFFKLNFGFKTKKIETYSSKPIDKYVDDPIYTDKFLLFGHFGIGYALANGINPDFFYLFNIRNPLNRLLSNYYRNKKLNDNENKKFLSKEDFFKLRISEKQDNLYTRFLSGERINEKSWHDNSILDQEMYENAIKNLEKINFFFVLEDSKNCFIKLKKKLKILLPLSSFLLLHKNKVSNSIFPEINTKEKDLLEELTHFDKKIYDLIIERNYN